MGKEIETKVTWSCPNCAGQPEFSHKEMLVHVREVHGIDPKNTKGTKTMQMHVDGRLYHSTTYDWELEGLHFYQAVTRPRNPWR